MIASHENPLSSGKQRLLRGKEVSIPNIQSKSVGTSGASFIPGWTRIFAIVQVPHVNNQVGLGLGCGVGDLGYRPNIWIVAGLKNPLRHAAASVAPNHNASRLG